MPEIKNIFTEGKMNKDLDERLVPRGQYIDAMNVEVTTSEDSDVGTVQSVHGNTLISGSNLIPSNSVCVGSVTNDATDSLYWLTAVDKSDFVPAPGQLLQDVNAIFEYSENNTPLVNPVFVDVHKVMFGIDDQSQNGPYYWSQPFDTSYFWVSDELNIHVGMMVYVYKAGIKEKYGKIIDILPQSQLGSIPQGTVQVVVDGNYDLFESGIPTWLALIFEGEITGWTEDTLITGINIVDDMLFWTDNNTEPKKINIQRSKEGTFQYNNLNDIKHTNLIVKDEDKGPITKKDITVIKQKPLTRIELEMKGKREVNSGVYGWVKMNGRRSGPGSEILTIGREKSLDSPTTLDSVSFNGINKFDYKIGDIVLLKYNPTQPTTSLFPITHDYNIKGKISRIDNNEFTSSSTGIKIKILDINYDNYPGSTGVAVDYFWSMQKQLNEDQLFELKFPRFSYRWKFEDGEYSAFAPWSNTAFLPGEYRYLPKEGFNNGMVNELRELILLDFIPPDMPRDVVQIDLLYKESDATNVYIVDSLKKDDPPPIDGNSGLLENPWNSAGSQGENGLYLPKGRYKVTSETIFGSVSSNQLVRNWDAVPRKALAQEVIGNRLIYANYVRNFNLTPAPGYKFKQDLTISYKSSDVANWNKRTVKTIRDYQVGVAYIDEFGRETPVFTHNDATVSIPKLVSDKSNIINVKLNNFPPRHADAYKFYIKENSNKYYNLVMDRWYDAEDDDIWLSFNSHDRNKLTEETFLYLKRGHDGSIIKDNYRYKILDIKNEAPEFVRTVRKQHGIKPNNVANWTNPATSVTYDAADFATGQLYNISGSLKQAFPVASARPEVGKKTFQILKELINYSSWVGIGGGPFSADINIKNRIRFLEYPSTTTVTHRDNGSFHFDEEAVKRSDWYKIDKVVNTGGNYVINLGRELENDCLFVSSTSSSGVVTMNSNIAIEIAEDRDEKLPEFDGRFFVKVLRDATIDEHIVGGSSYTVLKSQPLYYFNQPDVTGPTYDAGNASLKLYKEHAYNDADYSGSVVPTDDSDFEHVHDLWAARFGDGSEQETGDGAKPKWFIDNLKYAASQWGTNVFPNGGVHFPAFEFSDKTPGAGNGIDDVNNTIDISFSCITHSQSHLINNQYPTTPWYPNISGAYFSLAAVGAFQLNEGGQFGHGGMGAGNPVHDWLWDHLDEKDLVMNYFLVGKQFKFNEDPNNIVYTITAVETYNRWNYLDDHLWLDGISDYSSNTDYAKGQNGTTTLYDPSDPVNVPNFIGNLMHPTKTANNRRITFRLFLDKAIGDSSYDPTSNSGINSTTTNIEFLNVSLDDTLERTSNSPAIWETEPLEIDDIDIYYEASTVYPRYLTTSNISTIFSIGDKVRLVDTVNNNLDVIPGKEAEIIEFDTSQAGKVKIENINATNSFELNGNAVCRIYKKNDEVNYIELTTIGDNTGNQETWIYLQTDTHKWGRTLDWFNAYSFGNGVESDTIRDDFNQVEVGNGVTASTTVGWQYEEERLKNGLIFSGLYNAKTGLNDLNQFIEAENITKDTNPSYGSIQKLHTRDSDLIAFCEDKVLKILANKDALYNADENPNLISAENVLGQVLPFVGDYGISTNPESFAKENFRSYFTDKRRGAVLRLSRDGLTPISLNGMKDWFRDNFKSDVDQRLIGSYDNHKSHYNLSLTAANKTVVFNENSKGWVSFKSFVPEGGQSMNNDYFTFKDGKIYKHHVGPINTFYGGTSVDSTLTFVFNEEPSTVKTFTALNYEGTQSKIIARNDDSEYYNLQEKRGWAVEYIVTDKQEGTVREFIEKEGKWFNYIKGESSTIENFDTREFSFQGISTVSYNYDPPTLILGADQLHYGCEDAYNDPAMNITINTGNCVEDDPI